MKKSTLTLFVALACASHIRSQTTLKVFAPVGATSTELRAPNGTADHTYLRHIQLIRASELTHLTATTINTIAFVAAYGGAPSTVTGNISLYLQNTADVTFNKSLIWATAVTGMTNNFTGTITVPNSTGASTINMALSTPFTYTGGGIYVAWDYNSAGPYNTAANAAGYYASNVGTGNNLSASAYSSVAPTPTAITANDFRATLLFIGANTATNDIGVARLDAPGKVSKLGPPHVIKATLRNNSTVTLSNVTVSLAVSGANTFNDTQTITSIAAGAAQQVTFAPFNPTTNGINTMTVSTGSDINPANNALVWSQSVTCSDYSNEIPVALSNYVSGDWGFVSSGIYSEKVNFPVTSTITAVRLGVSTNTNNLNKSIYGTLQDATGNVIATTNTISIASSTLYGTYLTMVFPTPQTLTANSDYFVGAAATTGTFYPFSTIVPGTYTSAGYFQQTSTYIPLGYYSTSPSSGGTPSQHGLGYMPIEAVMGFSNTVITVSATRTKTCKGEKTTLTTTTSATGLTYAWSTGTATTNSIVVTPTLSGSGVGNVTYTVTATDGVSGCQSVGAMVTVSISACTGIDDTGDFGAEVSVFPNPISTGKATIKGLEGQNTITVMNVLGQAVLNFRSSDEEVGIDLKDQPAGNYLVKITNASNQSKVVKIIVQN